MNKNQELVIANKIIVIRGEHVILDLHLAEFYEVETRTLKQAVRRNIDRFPDDFLFQLSNDEIDEVVSQNVIPSKSHFGGAVPFAFTENGVAMLSSVLNSKKAIEMNIAIMRTFTMLRKAIMFHQDIKLELKNVKSQLNDHDEKLLIILEYISRENHEKKKESEFKQRKRIGY